MKVTGGIQVYRVEGPKGVYLTGEYSTIAKKTNGSRIPSSQFTIEARGVEVDVFTILFSVDGGEFSATAPPAVTMDFPSSITIDPWEVEFNTLSILASAEDTMYQDVFTITVVADGEPGPFGQVSFQKEWVQGDTHRYNDNIKDFVYVRGASQSDSYWYTLAEKGDVTAGAPPIGGAAVDGYTRVDWLRSLAVNVLLVEEANLANFIFKDGMLWSVRGTVDGVAANYSGQNNFVPNIVLDGANGKIYAVDGEFSGIISARGGNVGVLQVNETGSIILHDPDSGQQRLLFSEQDIPTVADLRASTTDGGETSNTARSGGTTFTLPNTMAVTKNNSNVTFQANTVMVTGSTNFFPPQYPGGITPMDSVSVIVEILRNGAYYALLASRTLQFSGLDEWQEASFSINRTLYNCLAGSYSIRVRVESSGNIYSKNASISASTMSWQFEQDVDWFQFGLNGFMAYYLGHHIHVSREKGVDIRGGFNAPGVLAKGRILSNGSRVAEKAWGAKNVTTGISKQGTGGYRVPVNCPDAHYDVNVSPRTANRTFIIGATTATYFEVYFRDHNGNLADSEFSYTVVGGNY